MKIAFCEENITYRGTSIALYDYANYNEIILNNKSIIVYKSCQNDIVLKKFSIRFPIFKYSTIDELNRILSKQNCNHIYSINQGYKSELPAVKNFIHCVYDMTQPHGDVYAGVSQSLAEKFGQSVYLPHMIGLKPDLRFNMRSKLGIPDTATVFGRYGGFDTFNVSFCLSAIEKVVNSNSNIYFLLNSVQQFIIHPQVIFYNILLITDQEKNLFISTCDAYLECCSLGHSFGLSLGEFAVHNRPALIYSKPNNSFWNDAHLKIVGQNGLLFQTEQQFIDLITNFNKVDYQQKDNNYYRNYNPEKIMNIFKTLFLNNK